MSQSKTLVAADVTTVRTKDDGSGGQGAGQNQRVYVGRKGAAGTRRNYKTFAKFTTTGMFDDVGTIISATLQWYTDDGLGSFPLPAATDTPKIKVRRLTDAFTEGNDSSFDESDYTTAATTSPDMTNVSM